MQLFIVYTFKQSLLFLGAGDDFELIPVTACSTTYMYNITVLTEMELTSMRHNKYKILEEQLNGFIALHVNTASF